MPLEMVPDRASIHLHVYKSLPGNSFPEGFFITRFWIYMAYYDENNFPLLYKVFGRIMSIDKD
jgi:hypothetical protein